ncbi:MAG: hypothetical protein P4L77_11190 [Sulfuriferula sp.]|nr:hypothetical protein [Sulfuriferula sp.]
MSFIRRFLSRCFLFVERRLKGNKSVKNISLPEDQDFVGVLTGYSVTGYEIKIYCSKVRYRKKYSRWYVPPSNIDLYHVYSTVSADAPDSLKAACALEITIPPPHPDFLNFEFQKDAAIEWYLDLLIQRMSPGDRFNS